MPHADNKVDWCLKKAEKELKETGRHRGLVKKKPDISLARMHVRKAEHNLKAMTDFKNTGYSDPSTPSTTASSQYLRKRGTKAATKSAPSP